MEKYFISKEMRVAKPTIYAEAHGSGGRKDEFCDWFIHSGYTLDNQILKMTEVVNGFDGDISIPRERYYNGTFLGGIRPVTWIDLTFKSK